MRNSPKRRQAFEKHGGQGDILTKLAADYYLSETRKDLPDHLRRKCLEAIKNGVPTG
jgi:hypothetical protein